MFRVWPGFSRATTLPSGRASLCQQPLSSLMPWATDEGLCGVVACQPGRHVYGAAAELQLRPPRSCWPRPRAQDSQVLAVHVLDEPASNCEFSSGTRADVDVLGALRRDQERAPLGAAGPDDHAPAIVDRYGRRQQERPSNSSLLQAGFHGVCSASAKCLGAANPARHPPDAQGAVQPAAAAHARRRERVAEQEPRVEALLLRRCGNARGRRQPGSPRPGLSTGLRQRHKRRDAHRPVAHYADKVCTPFLPQPAAAVPYGTGYAHRSPYRTHA